MADDLRAELHAVDGRVIRVETELRLTREELKEHRTQSANQHQALIARFDRLTDELSDQGRTPGPPPSLPPGAALATLPPGPTLEPAQERSGDTGEIRISPKRVAPWVALVARGVRWLLFAGIGAGAGHAVEHWGPTEPPAIEEGP